MAGVRTRRPRDPGFAVAGACFHQTTGLPVLSHHALPTDLCFRPLRRDRAGAQTGPALFEPTRLVRALHGALAVLALGTFPAVSWAQAENLPEPPLQLKSGEQLTEELAPEVRNLAPTFVSGDQLSGTTDGPTVIEGGAELRRHDTVIRADRLTYDRNTGDAQATGNVILNRSGDRFVGPDAQINVDAEKGYFNQPVYHLLRSNVHGDARRIDFLGEDKMEVLDGRYSTCPRVPGAAWMPDWLLRASTIELDNAQDVGTARSGTLEFKGVPFLNIPYLTFPLSDQRKSGVLPPSVALDSTSGFTATVPYYINLAPNYDLTLEPTLMAKRGVDLGAEFRYLQPGYSGELRAAYMPSDYLRDTHRWSYGLKHHQVLGQITGADRPVGLSVDLMRVSDDNYWSDFPRSINTITTRLLRNNAVLSWGQGPWSVTGGAYTYQTLQNADSPITPPYDQVPAVTATYRNANQSLLGSAGWEFTAQANSTRFQRSNFTTTDRVQGDGSRAYVMGELTRRWQTPGWYVQPRARVHSAVYNMDQSLGAGVRTSRTIPTLSVDSGMVFERQTAYLGRDYVQTLEPRLFGTWTPFRDQSGLPNFDSATRSFNLASMFTENAFGGNDRISDTRAITMGLSSRLIDPASGAEIVRLGWAQRALLENQNVTLPGGAAVTDRMSDMLVSARVQWDPLWSLDTTVQYNQKSDESARSTIGGRYTPGPFQVISAAYRIQRGVSKQLELGWQWPLSSLMGESPARVPGRALGPNQWYGVGRMNYSTLDKKVVDLIAGFEYDAGCWLGRVVMERLQQNTTSATQRVLFQLEFSGFSRLGGSSLQTLASNIPKYEYLREEVLPPSRFQQYD